MLPRLLKRSREGVDVGKQGRNASDGWFFDFQQLLEVKIVLFMTTRLWNMLIRETLTK